MARFSAQARVAFHTFRQDLYEPLKAGALSRARHNKLAAGRAASALRAAIDRVILAKQYAQEGTALRKLFGPMAGLVPLLSGIQDSLRHHRPDVEGIKAANAAITNIEQIATAAGVSITEKAPAING